MNGNSILDFSPCARFLAFALACAAGLSAVATDALFPDADGKGDLASTASWGVDPIPDATNRLQFHLDKLAAGAHTFTASADISFAGIGFRLGSARPLTLDMRDSATGATGAPRKITLTSSVVPVDASDNDVTFLGGDWTGTLFGMDAYGRGGNTYRVKGARMTFTGNIMGGYGSNGSRIIFDEGCVVTAATMRAQHNYGGNNQIHVLGGSKIVLTGTDQQLYTGQGNWAGDSDNGIWVSGTGSRVEVAKAQGTCLIGVHKVAGGHFLKIDDNAQVIVPKLIQIGQGNGGTNFISVTDGGILTADSIQIGHYGALDSTGNYVFVGEGGTLNVTNVLRLGSYEATNSPRGNSFIVSNGTYRGVFPLFSKCTRGSNHVVRVMGRKSVFDAGRRPDSDSLSIFWRESGCLVEFDNAVWTNNVAKKIYLNDNQSARGGCTFSLKNNAEFYTTNSFYMTGESYANRDCLVSVASGSRFHAGGDVKTWSMRTVFAVSNGTFEVGKDLAVTATGGNESSQGGISNNWLKVAGDAPRVSVTNGTFSLYRGSYLSYDLPATGYAAGLVPVKVKAFNVNDVASRVYVNGIEARQTEMVRTKCGSETVTLVESANSISFNATALAASQALMPKGASLYLSSDKKKLLLKIRSRVGFAMVLR